MAWLVSQVRLEGGRMIHSFLNYDMSYVRRSLITLQDGKIIRVEKIAPPPAEQMKSFGAVAA